MLINSHPIGRMLVLFAYVKGIALTLPITLDVGDDVDMCIQRLVSAFPPCIDCDPNTFQLQAANWDPNRASMGIVYIDEVDKIARKSSPGGTEGSRDVAGEGVQQALLRMMEGSVVTVQAKGGAEAPPAGGDARSRPPHRNLNVGGRKCDTVKCKRRH